MRVKVTIDVTSSSSSCEGCTTGVTDAISVTFFEGSISGISTIVEGKVEVEEWKEVEVEVEEVEVEVDEDDDEDEANMSSTSMMSSQSAILMMQLATV